MKSEYSYMFIALEDLQDAQDLFNLGRYNKSVKYCQQFIEKAMKEIIYRNTPESQDQALKDKVLLSSHNLLNLADRVCEILGESYTSTERRYFRDLKNFYFNVSYPGDAYERVDKETAKDCLIFALTFKAKIEQQQLVLSKNIEDHFKKPFEKSTAVQKNV